MRKITTTFGLICLVIGLFWFATRLISPEDTWLCVNGQWVKHGRPKDPPPASGCEAQSSPTATLGEETAAPSAEEPQPQATPTGLANPAAVNAGEFQPKKWAGQIKAYTPEAPFKYFLQTLANENFTLQPLENGDPEVWRQIESFADKDVSVELTGYFDLNQPGIILVKSVKTNE